MMLNQRYFSCFMTLGLLFTGTNLVLASPVLPTNTIARAKISNPKILFKPPTNDRRPLRTIGAGSRGGQCAQDLAAETTRVSNALPLLALVPRNNTGLTVAERPTFWTYLPQTSAKQIVLSLQAEDASSHFQWSFPVPSAAGIVSFQVPADAPPLQIGQAYQWAVVLVCGERPNPNDPAIAAWVKRVSPPQPVQSKDQMSWNGEQGLWYDRLTSLGQQLRTQPTNLALTNIWTNVLKSERLEMVAMEPFRQE